MQEILELPRVERLVVARGIPDGRHPSDHLMLAARFRLAGTSGTSGTSGADTNTYMAPEGDES